MTDNYQTDSFKTALTFCIILLFGLVLRLTIHLNGPLGFDEITTWVIARRASLLDLWNAGLSEPTPPLYETLVHYAMYFLGNTPALMRIPSVLFGVLMLPLTFWIMRLGTFSTIDSLCAMAIVSVSSMLIYYSQELRAYSMLAFTGVLSVGLLIRCLKKPSNINCLLFAITIFILPHTHRYGFLLIAAELFCIILYRQWKLSAFFSISVFLVLMLLVLQVIAGKFNYAEAIDRRSHWGSVIALINMLNVGTIELRILRRLPGYYATLPSVSYSHGWINNTLSLSGLSVFAAIFLYGLSCLRNYTHEQKQVITVLVICIIIPSVLALIGGSPLAPKPQWLLRGLIYIWPLYYMATVAFCSISRYKPYFIGAIIVLNCFSLYPYYTAFNRCPEAAAFERLNSQTNENDIIVANPWYFYGVVDYYYHGRAQKAAYDATRGWVDVKKLRESDPFYFRNFPVTSQPTATGNVYFFWLIDDEKCIRPFTNRKIFLYKSNDLKPWERYTIKERKVN